MELDKTTGLQTPPNERGQVPTKLYKRPLNYQCMVCQKRFNRPCRLAEHERQHTGERPFKCGFPGCDKSYMRETHLTVHSRTHSTELKHKYQCDFPNCQKGFNTNQHLKRHMITHQTPKPFQCTYQGCQEAFAKRHQLHLHTCKQHTSQNPYGCPRPNCDKSFQYPSQLKRHLRVHDDTVIRYRCGYPDCSAKFSKWSQLQTHKKEDHKADEILHKCHLCEATFKRRHGLTVHLLRHNPNRPVYSCTIDGCSRFYLDENALRAHIRTIHSDQKPQFPCTHEGCDKSYAYAHTLRNHVAKCHSNSAAVANATPAVVTKKRKRQQPQEPLQQPTDLEIALGIAYSDPTISGRLCKCPVPDCPYQFKRDADLDVHLTCVHNN